MELIGFFGTLFLTFCALPELFRTIKNKRCHLGWGFILMWFFGEILCLIYVLSINNNILLLNYGFNLLVVSIMLFYKLKNHIWKR